MVDSADLPLNVSRAAAGKPRREGAIRDGCTKRVLSMLEDLAKHDQRPAATEGADGVTDVSDEDLHCSTPKVLLRPVSRAKDRQAGAAHHHRPAG